MTISEDQLSAWLHGSVDPAEAERIAARVANDPELTKRADRLRQLDSLVRSAVPISETLPPELLVRLGLAAQPPVSNVLNLADARASRSTMQKPSRIAAFASGGWKVAAQVALIVGIGTAVVQFAGPARQSSPEAAYRALGDGPTAEASANALVMFDADLDEHAVKAVAGRVGAQLIGGETQAGVWRLSIDPAKRDDALSQLRAMPDVRMAEAIDGARQ